jgi:hypothetical protein
VETPGIYETILSELDSGVMTELERKIFDALSKHREGLKRGQLVAICFGESVKAGASNNNNGKDRRVRMAIGRLRERMVPIVSSSGEAGYRLDTSETARKRMVMDLVSRRDKLTELINRMARIYAVPVEFPTPEIVKQERLI